MVAFHPQEGVGFLVVTGGHRRPRLAREEGAARAHNIQSAVITIDRGTAAAWCTESGKL